MTTRYLGKWLPGSLCGRFAILAANAAAILNASAANAIVFVLIGFSLT